MKLRLTRVILPLKHPFTIARGTITSQASWLVELDDEAGHIGLGEVTENSFYHHSKGSLLSSFKKAASFVHNYQHKPPSDLWELMVQHLAGDMFAAAAIDLAAHDLYSKQASEPCFQTWKLQWNSEIASSFTIGIDSIDRMIAKLMEEPHWPIYKIKLGTPSDIEIIQRLREVTQAVFRVDANCAWSAKQTIEHSHKLSELGVEFIEQPLPPDAPPEDKRYLRESSALPIIADEDCQRLEDVEKCLELYDGINVKLCKCGGLSPALQMLKFGKQRGLKTMVGCMVESSIGISAAAHLLPLLDFADLDGAYLLRDEPCSGVTVRDGKVDTDLGIGLGCELLQDRLKEFPHESYDFNC